MAQHDYIIANQGFPSFRSDMNNAFSATVTNNSGTSEPSTKYSGMIFADTIILNLQKLHLQMLVKLTL
jgi:hypothetical protein